MCEREEKLFSCCSCQKSTRKISLGKESSISSWMDEWWSAISQQWMHFQWLYIGRLIKMTSSFRPHSRSFERWIKIEMESFLLVFHRFYVVKKVTKHSSATLSSTLMEKDEKSVVESMRERELSAVQIFSSLNLLYFTWLSSFLVVDNFLFL